MTLPCDASRETYPDNKVGKYTTVLAREISLDGDFEVGLSECVIPQPQRSLNFKQSLLWAETGVSTAYQPYEIDASAISTLTDFPVDELQLPQTSKGTDVFKFSVRDKKIVMTVAPNCIITFDQSNGALADLLGFKLGPYRGGSEQSREHIAQKPFGGSGTLYFIYIYCDLVQYSFLGDSMVPVLRILPVIPGDSKITVLRFENPHYIPVAQSRFSQVSIEICNDQGEEIEFSKGLSMIKLHFRPKKR